MTKTLLLASLAIVGVAAQTAPGVITGNVVGPGGVAIASAVVTAYLQPPGGSNTGTPFSANALSSSQGQFELDGLQPGTYLMCAEQQSASMLNPCIWSGQQTTTTVTSGATTSGVSITMLQGVNVGVRLNIPSAILSTFTSSSGVSVSAGYGTNPPQNAVVSSTDALGVTLSLLIPAGQAVPLNVSSSMYSLANALGVPFTGQSFAVPVNIPSGQATTVTLQVTGLLSIPLPSLSAKPKQTKK